MTVNMKTPAVTVLIDTFNHERFIEEAIVSVLEQDFPATEMEILVVDDGSTDRTPELVRKFAPRVRYARKENGGQASAFNFGIPMAQGEIIAFLDGDDWWAKPKVSKVVQTLSSRPDVGVVGHGIYEVDSDTGRTSATLPEESGDIDLHTVAGAAFFRHMMCFFGPSRVAHLNGGVEPRPPLPHRARDRSGRVHVHGEHRLFYGITDSGAANVLQTPHWEPFPNSILGCR